MSGVQGRCDGASLDPESLSDRLVVEVGVVTEEDDEPLALREQGDRRGQACILRRRGAVRPGLQVGVVLGPSSRCASLVAGPG